MTNREKEQARAMFHQIDKDYNGSINIDELEACLCEFSIKDHH